MLFEAIDRHGPLPTHYLYQFTKHIRRDYTHLQNRLTEFYNGDARGPFLVRPPQQFAGFEARYQHIVYGLATRARHAISERGALGRFSPRRSDPFLHQLMQACVGASLELTAHKAGLRYITREEILSHPKCGVAKNAKNPMAIELHGLGEKVALVPDDLFGIEYANGAGFRFFAVEIDRNTESIERKNLDQNAFGKKVARYLQILREKTYRDWWGVPNLNVLTITTNATHGCNILDYIAKQADPRYAQRFAVACEPSFGVNWRVPKTVLTHLIEEPWATVGEPKNISLA